MEEEKQVQNDKPGIFDNAIMKVSSRKLLVWIVSTVGMFLDVIDPQTWVYISMIYIGAQAAVDGVNMWKGNDREI